MKDVTMGDYKLTRVDLREIRINGLLRWNESIHCHYTVNDMREMWFGGVRYLFEELLLTSLVLLFEDGAQGGGLAAIVGGGAGAYADEGEGAFFANLGGSLALGDFVDELAVAQAPAT
jgi:hypothetical protein